MEQLTNRTYYLCFDQIYTGSVLVEWINSGKEPELTFRNASKGVENCVVLKVTDHNGDDLVFINHITRITSARVEIR